LWPINSDALRIGVRLTSDLVVYEGSLSLAGMEF